MTERLSTHTHKKTGLDIPLLQARRQVGGLARSSPGSLALESTRELPESVYAPSPHYSLYLVHSLLFKSYLPCEDRLAVRNEHAPPASLLGQCRDDLAQGQQRLVNAHAFLGTRSNILIKRNCSRINLFHKIYFFPNCSLQEKL